MEQYLEHHGILGQKWGVRRFQNKDGSLTKAGAKRYGEEGSRTAKQTQKRLNDVQKAIDYNKRASKEADRTMEYLGAKYQKKFKGQPFSSDDFSKRDRKMASSAAKSKFKAQANIHDGEEEINRILKQAGKQQFDVASKDIKRDTTKNNERIASALLVAGSIPLGLLPGPNAAAAVAVGSAVNMTKRNMVDSKKYSVKQKTAPSSEERRRLIEEAQKAEFNRREKSGKPFKDRSEAVDEYNKIAKRMNDEWSQMKGYKFTKAERKVMEKRDNDRYEMNRLNAAEQLRYGNDRNKASKYIRNMSDKDLLSESKKWRESAEYHRKNGDNNQAKEWESNAKLYEKEIKRRSSKDFNG